MCVLLLPVLATAAAHAETIGKNPGKIKGRWLEVKDRQALSAVKGVYLGELSSDIQWKNEHNEAPLDEELLDENLRERLLERLRESRALGEVLSEPPAAGETGYVRLDADLEVEPGSRIARYAVGLGAGKSRSILEVHFVDHATGEEIALYHGYGTGSGMGFKLAGGSARKMTQDDIQENTKKMVELLAEVR